MIAVPIGLAYNGTLVPLVIGIFICVCGARILIGRVTPDFDPN
jgi:hypothetical protein